MATSNALPAAQRNGAMPDDSLIVSVQVPSGTLHFAPVKSDATAHDVIAVLRANRELKAEVLDDLDDDLWALQRMRREERGRAWEKDELDSLGDGILDSSEPIAPLLATTAPKTATVHRHFSAFPLTSHMHTPVLRLISLHPHLCITVSFARVPEIEDDFTWRWYLARTTTVEEVLDGVGTELGLAKVIYGPGGGNIDYVLEEVWTHKDESECAHALA
ncbi:hypothetical protein AURDEDRAFT_162426 [Auricularia subglabra TFB-10046 SS5]|nr:hypothetical protein AURDEDRAFT_162426 [Auricularia subglabra TFB-10046 SS5]